MQKDIIIESEADAWFLRNKEVLLKRTSYPYLESILKYIKRNEQVVEIGSSFGYNLNFMVDKVGCKGFGLEPSQLAVNYGKEHYPNIQLKSGTIDKADLFDQKFDHVIIGFCLYLADLDLLPEIIFRIDKILKKGGYLHIFDFDSKYPVERAYAHDNRIKTRKMDYGQIFSSLPNYFLAEKSSWSHQGNMFHSDINERCSTITLFKEL